MKEIDDALAAHKKGTKMRHSMKAGERIQGMSPKRSDIRKLTLEETSHTEDQVRD